MVVKRTINRTSLLTQIVSHANEEPKQEIDSHLFVPTGSSILNLALSDQVKGGFGVGKIVNIIGDHSSGKTFLSLSLFAEANRLPEFNKYQFIFDDVEQANEFNMNKLLGETCAQRIKPPDDLKPITRQEEENLCSHTIQDFQFHVQSLLKKRKPFIYILDSFDALTSEEELTRADKVHKARETGKEMAGTYGMEKAKHSSEILRIITAGMKKTKSLLVIISQTRDNIDPMSFQKRTRSGGKALGFYASVEMWLALERKIKMTIEGRDRAVGVSVKIKVSKNKLNGKTRDVKAKIFYSYGIDDIGGCIDWLVEESIWQKDSTGRIIPEGIGCQPTRLDKLILFIEEENKGEILRSICQKAWLKIEKSMELKRLPRYS